MKGDIYEDFKQQVIQAVVDEGLDQAQIDLFTPPKKEFGELSTNIAFKLASETGENPRKLAQEIVNGLDLNRFPLIEKAVLAGAGYINFYINYDHFTPEALGSILEAGHHYGDLELGASRRIIIEHTSVNPNKPWHIGHLRNAILGDTLSRIFRKAGYEVEIQNYIDDTGKQVADTIYALEYFGTNLNAEAKFDHLAGAEYVRLHQILDEEKPKPSAEQPSAEVEAIQQGIERVMHELEEGVHRPFVERCVNAQLETAFRLGVFYDLLIWEGDIVRARLLEEAMAKIQKTKYVHMAQEGYAKGCLIIEMGNFLEQVATGDEEYHVDKILIRSNGLPTYTAKDIAFHMWKFSLLANDMNYRIYIAQPNGLNLWTTHPRGEKKQRQGATDVLNVIGFEQEYPQTVVRTALKILGYEKQYENFNHLAYGHVWLPEGRMRGRKGTGAIADEVIEAAIAEAYQVVFEKRGEEYIAEELIHIAEAVGVSAIRLAMLRKNPETQVTFKLSEVISFSGYTALYLQYAYVRATAILEKTEPEDWRTDPSQKISLFSQLKSEAERALILQLSQLPLAIRNAVEQKNPALMCQYGYDVAQSFTEFYNTSPVLGAAPGIKLARLQLVQCTATVLQIVFQLLGVSVLERM